MTRVTGVPDYIADVGMAVCHVVTCWMCLVVCARSTLPGRKTNSLCCRDKVEDVHIRPGHQWMCEFGDADNDTSCEKEFNLSHRTWEDYRGTRVYKGDCALVIKVVAQQTGGGCVRTNVPRVDAECWHITGTCVYDDQLKWLTCRLFQARGRASSNTWDSCTWWLAVMRSGTAKSWGEGPKSSVLSVDDDTEFRSPCDWVILFFTLKSSIFPKNCEQKKSRGGCARHP
jgi:hypothetical protein